MELEKEIYKGGTLVLLPYNNYIGIIRTRENSDGFIECKCLATNISQQYLRRRLRLCPVQIGDVYVLEKPLSFKYFRVKHIKYDDRTDAYLAEGENFSAVKTLVTSMEYTYEYLLKQELYITG